MTLKKWIKKEMALKFDFKFDDEGKVDWEIEVGWIWICFFAIMLYPPFSKGVEHLISDCSKFVQMLIS